MRPAMPHASPAPAPTLRLALPGYLHWYEWSDVFVLLWQRGPDGDAVQRISRGVAERMAAHDGSPNSVVHVMYPSAGLPTRDAWVGLIELGKRWYSRTACVGMVVEGDGVLRSAFRAAHTELLALVSVRFTVAITKDLPDMATWLSHQHAAKTGVSHRPDVLLGVLEALRSAHP